jgi:hypothetical protein
VGIVDTPLFTMFSVFLYGVVSYQYPSKKALLKPTIYTRCNGPWKRFGAFNIFSETAFIWWRRR